MILAGVRISDRVVLDLADRLRDGGFDTTVETLEHALAWGAPSSRSRSLTARRSSAFWTIHPRD
jgi:hypothetical protein